MGFFEWISSIFGSNSAEENKDNENISTNNELRSDIKNAEQDVHERSEALTDQISNDLVAADIPEITESDEQGPKDQQVTEDGLRSQENDETQA